MLNRKMRSQTHRDSNRSQLWVFALALWGIRVRNSWIVLKCINLQRSDVMICCSSPCPRFSRPCLNLLGRLDKRNLTAAILKAARRGCAGKLAVAGRGITVADENRSSLQCTASLHFTPADSYSHAGVSRDALKLCCSAGSSMLGLWQEDAAQPHGCCCWGQALWSFVFCSFTGKNQI